MNEWRPRLSFCCVLCSLWLWLELENPEVLLTATLDDTHTHAHRVRHHQPHNSSMEWEERVEIVREHFVKKGYRVHSGLQFGCELVLYADSPGRVHSDFCVHVVREGMCVCVLFWCRRRCLVCVCVCVCVVSHFFPCCIPVHHSHRSWFMVSVPWCWCWCRCPTLCCVLFHPSLSVSVYVCWEQMDVWIGE